MRHNRSEAKTSENNNEACQPETKKARLLKNTSSSLQGRLPSKATAANTTDHVSRVEKYVCTRWFINDYNDSMSAKIPLTLSNTDKDTERRQTTKIGQDLNKLRRLLDMHGLRTSKISSPREAVSIYKDSCRIQHADSENDISARDGKGFLLVTFGIHLQQEDIEKDYEDGIRDAYCLFLFCKKIRQEYCDLQRSSSSSNPLKNETATDDDDDVQRLFCQIEKTHQLVKSFTQKDGCRISSRFAEEQVNALIELAVNVKGKRSYRKEEWRKEYQRICIYNSTISNAYMFLLQSNHGMCIKDIYLKLVRQEPKYERITIYLYDPAIDHGRRPDLFLFLPGLNTIVTKGPRELVSDMVDSFWGSVIRNGYFPTSKLQRILESKLRCFFLSGLTGTNTLAGSNNNLPFPLKANFSPTSPLSIYLHGKAGSGMFFRFEMMQTMRVLSSKALKAYNAMRREFCSKDFVSSSFLRFSIPFLLPCSRKELIGKSLTNSVAEYTRKIY
jgi:hypothetical protein